MIKMNLQLFGGRGSGGGNNPAGKATTKTAAERAAGNPSITERVSSKSSPLKVVAGKPFISQNGEYIDQIAALSKRPKTNINDFSESKTGKISVKGEDGEKLQLKQVVDYGGDAGRHYTVNTQEREVFTQNSIYKDKKGSYYVVTKEYTVSSYIRNGNFQGDVKSRVKKLSRLK